MATGAILGGISVGSGLIKGKMGKDASKAAGKSYDKAGNVITDFMESGDYDPGGSSSSGSSFNNSNSAGASDSFGASAGSSFGSGSSSGSSSGTSSRSGSSQSGYNLGNAQDLMNDWEVTYGGIEDNLSDYYNNLDPSKYALQYKTNLSQDIDKQLAQTNDELASSGLMSAGMRAQSEKEAAFTKATGNANADLAAEDRVREMQTSFLNRGENRKSMYDNALTGVSSSSDISSTSSNTSRNLSNNLSGSVNNSLNTSQSNNYSNSVGGSENTSESRNSNYAPIQDLSNVYSGQAGQSAKDASGFISGGLKDVAGGIGGIVEAVNV